MKLNPNMKTLWGKLLGLGLGLWAAGVSAQPVITNQPISQTVIYGGNATFSVMVTGVGPITYQWQYNGTNLSNNIITTVAGKGSSLSDTGDNGGASGAGIYLPYGIAMDKSGNIFIATGANRVRKVDNNGIITTVAGGGSGGDGGAATNAKLIAPFGLALDKSGNLFIADSGNNRIRKVDTNGLITTVAGGGAGGDGGLAVNASLNSPYGLAMDTSGNFFISEFQAHRIRKVDTNGYISTVAGSGTAQPFSGDGGPATSANIDQPWGVAVDTNGNFYIADYQHARIRKVGTNGIINTVAGNGTQSYAGDNGAATSASLYLPTGVAVDTSGNLIIADRRNQRIRMVGTNGIITTVAGNGYYNGISGGFAGDGGVATNAELATPTSVVADDCGNLFIADSVNGRIRKTGNTQGRTLRLNNASMANAGNYQLVVTNSGGSVTSSVVSLNLQLPPVVPVFSAASNAVTFTWSAISNLTYQLQSATNLTAPAWQNLGSPVTATNGTVSTLDIPAGVPQRFYRVQLVQ